MSLYFLKIGSNVYSTRLKTTNRVLKKTCMIGLTDRETAIHLESKLHCFEPGLGNNIQISEIDYTSPEFSKMMRLNNMALLIADGFKHHEDSIIFSGDLLDIELPIDDSNRAYLEMIYNKPPSPT